MAICHILVRELEFTSLDLSYNQGSVPDTPTCYIIIYIHRNWLKHVPCIVYRGFLKRRCKAPYRGTSWIFNEHSYQIEKETTLHKSRCARFVPTMVLFLVKNFFVSFAKFAMQLETLGNCSFVQLAKLGVLSILEMREKVVLLVSTNNCSPWNKQGLIPAKSKS